MVEFTKIVPTADKLQEGSFVDAQGLATAHGFGKVSQRWYDQTLSYEDAIAKLEYERTQHRDILTAIRNVEVIAEDRGIALLINNQRFKPTEHALRQFGNNAFVEQTPLIALSSPKMTPDGKNVRFERDERDYRVLADLMANGLRRVDPDKKFRFREGNDGQLRAMVTESYLTIDNRWVLEALAKIVPGGRISHFDRSTADSVVCNLLIPDTIREEDDSEYGGGLSVRNCEIGLYRFNLLVWLFRRICMNGNIWGKTEGTAFSRVHKGKTLHLDALFQAMKECIDKQIPLVKTGLDKLLSTRAMGTDGVSLRPIFAQVGIANKMTPAEVKEVSEQWHTFESDHRTLFGVVNAITRAGQKLSADRWTDFDLLGGKMVEEGAEAWGETVNRAKRLTAKEVDKAYAMATVA